MQQRRCWALLCFGDPHGVPYPMRGSIYLAMSMRGRIKGIKTLIATGAANLSGVWNSIQHWQSNTAWSYSLTVLYYECNTDSFFNARTQKTITEGAIAYSWLHCQQCEEPLWNRKQWQSIPVGHLLQRQLQLQKHGLSCCLGEQTLLALLAVPIVLMSGMVTVLLCVGAPWWISYGELCMKGGRKGAESHL